MVRSSPFIIGLLIVGCASEPNTTPPPVAAGPARLLGVVATPGESDFDVVADARIEVGSQVVYSDALGRFELTGLPQNQPINVRAFGPEGELFGSNVMTVTIPDGQASLSAELVLLRACDLSVDNRTGSAGFTSCMGDARAALSFPAGALDAETVSVRIATLDPVHTADRSGFNPVDERSVLGGIQVELTDARTGAPAQILAGQTVTVRFPLASVEGEIDLQWFDPVAETWIDQPQGRVVDGMYEFEATHFSSYRGVLRTTAGFNECLTFVPTVCSGSGCARTVHATITDLTNNRVTNMVVPETGACIPIDGRSEVLIRATYLENLNPGTPIHVFTRRLNAVGSDGKDTCTAECVDLGRAELAPRAMRCATAELYVSCGADCVEPYVGELDVMYRGARIARIGIPASCGEVCVPSPETLNDTVELKTSAGHGVSYLPDPAFVGTCDGSSACAATTDCQPLGRLDMACEQSFEGCIEAAFDYSINTNDPSCAPATPHAIYVDARRTVGSVSYYEWWLDGATSGPRVAETRTSLCVAEGTHQVTLVATSRRAFLISQRDFMTETIVVGTGAVRIDSDMGTELDLGESTTLRTILDQPGAYTYRWARGGLEDPTPMAETTADITVTPQFSEEYFIVTVLRADQSVYGEAHIRLTVDNNAYMHVEIQTSAIRPNPGQSTLFRPIAYDLSTGAAGVASCVHADVTEIHWVIHWLDTGDTQTADYVADPGTYLACDESVNGPVFQGGFPAGSYRAELTVVADGRQATDDLNFTVSW